MAILPTPSVAQIAEPPEAASGVKESVKEALSFFDQKTFKIIIDYTCAFDFIGLMIDHFDRINSQRTALVEESIRTRRVEVCDSGILYAQDAFEALKRSPEGASRLERFVRENTFYHGLVPIMAFKPKENGRFLTGREPCTFDIRPWMRPSEALQVVQEGRSYLDCGTTLEIARYLALKDLLGVERFDHLFAHNAPTPLEISNGGHLLWLLKKVEILSEEEIRRGDRVHYSNVLSYVAKTWGIGNANGFNAICSDDTQPKRSYMAFGIPGRATGDQIEQVLFENLNATPIPVSECMGPEATEALSLDSYFRRIREEMGSDPDTTTFTREQFDSMEPLAAHTGKCAGKLRLMVHRPRLDRIQLLANTPLKSIREVFVSFREGNS